MKETTIRWLEAIASWAFLAAAVFCGTLAVASFIYAFTN